MIEPDHRGSTCWPALDPTSGALELRSVVSSDLDPRGWDTVWRRTLDPVDAAPTFEWMCGASPNWVLWGRLAVLFGDEALDEIVIVAAGRAAEEAAIAAEEIRMKEDERQHLHRTIGLFVLDPKSNRPGLALESGDERKPFFKMEFSERWERERVLDWLRWQRSFFLEFRDQVETEGAVALERRIIAGMRETEADCRKRGLSSGGRRPLRFWRGE